MYKSVYELSREQLEELKESFFYDNWDDPIVLQYTYPAEIPDETIYNHYDVTEFTDDDFFCTASEVNTATSPLYKDYSPEDQNT